ncbi:MAG: hypothetical protein M5F18_03875 [Asgard group archaeon]|nr:hypothetical protein [Asgard group archaeon]
MMIAYFPQLGESIPYIRSNYTAYISGELKTRNYRSQEDKKEIKKEEKEKVEYGN